MSRIRKQAIAFLLCLCIITIPFAAMESQAVYAAENTNYVGDDDPPSAEDVEYAIEDFAYAVWALSEGMQSEADIEALLARGCGLGLLAGSAISILVMIGIIKDPTDEALAQILTEIGDVKDMLVQMDQKLDAISQQLIDMAVSQEEKDRQINARLLLSYWRDFNTNYVEPLQNSLDQYQGMVNSEIRKWWEAEKAEGIRVLYTDYEDKTVMTLSRKTYEEGFPETADNGETVLLDKSFGVPKDLIPKTEEAAFDIDTYKEKFSEQFTPAFIAAANAKQLDATDAFYADWNALDDEGKFMRAASYAADFLNTVIYHLSCDIMSTDENDQWVIDVMSQFRSYCDNLLTTDSGINALINVQYLTHGMEGEIRDDILTICDSMIATAGFYGSFALNVACQDAMQSSSRKAALQSLWVNTIKSLKSKKIYSLTGRDNYCYVAGAALGEKMIWLDTHTHAVQLNNKAYQSVSFDPWTVRSSLYGREIDFPEVLGDVYSVVLFHQYLCQKGSDDESFKGYLKNYKVNTTEDADQYISKYIGSQTFALAEGIDMYAGVEIGNYFNKKSKYEIYTEEVESVDSGCFVNHDKVVADLFDPETGEVSVNQTVLARAFYEEDHWYWDTDEMHIFSTGADDRSVTTREIEHWWGTDTEYTIDRHIYTSAYVLELVPTKLKDYPKDSPLVLLNKKYNGEGQINNASNKIAPADWDAVRINHLNLYSGDNEKLNQGIQKQIEMEIARAGAQGMNIVLTEAEKDQLAAQIKAKLFALQKELKNNQSLLYFDVFGFGRNTKAALKLAEAVLPGGLDYFGGNAKLAPKNTRTIARYEPWAALHFENKNGAVVPVLNTGFEVEPVLLAVRQNPKSPECFEISDEVMKMQSLKMDIRLSAASAIGDALTVIHYNSIEDQIVLSSEDAVVLGSGADRFVTVKAAVCSPFELTQQTLVPSSDDNQKTVPPTGDANNLMGWILILGIAFGVVAVGVVLIVIKKRRAAEKR